MSDQGQQVSAQSDIDTTDDDVRNAIAELKEAAGGTKEDSAQIVLDRPRDDKGRFAEALKEAPKKRETLTLKQPQPAEPGVTPPPADQTLGQTPPEPPKPPTEAPRGWKAEYKARFGELPPDIQAEVLRREQAFEKQLSAHDEARDTGRKINEMVTPYLPTIRAEGADPIKAFGDYLQTAHVLRSGTVTQKAQAIGAVVRQFGVDPNILFQVLQGGSVNNGGQQQPGAFDPRVTQLEATLQRLEQERQADIQRRQLEEESQLNGQIEDFASKPGHEHFESVRTYMGHLLESGAAGDLEEAYEKAIWADPQIRTSLIAAQSSAANGQRVTELNAKTAAARNAAGSVTGAPGAARAVSPPPQSNGSIEDDIRAAMREIRGRI